jgi:hypothetical protein
MQLKKNLNTVLGKIIGWFQANSLTLNFNKTYYSVTWTAHHSVNTPPKAVFLLAVPSRAEVSRSDPSRSTLVAKEE